MDHQTECQNGSEEERDPFEDKEDPPCEEGEATAPWRGRQQPWRTKGRGKTDPLFTPIKHTHSAHVQLLKSRLGS